MNEKVLPPACRLEIGLDRICIKFSNAYIVTTYSGARKFFKGTDGATYNRAAQWAWKFYEGWYRETHKLEENHESDYIVRD